MSDNSQLYYRNLLEISKDTAEILRRELAGVVHESYLQIPGKFNLLCYQKMFTENHGTTVIVDRDTMQKSILGLGKVCENCMPFFLSRRSPLKKSDDVDTGARLQKPLMGFLKSLSIDAFDATQKDMRLPDIGVKNRKGEVIALLEVKCHNAPFIQIRQRVEMTEYPSGKSECYDGSLTIDETKLQNQMKTAKELHPNAENLLVHWVDFPCLKCVLWDKLETGIGDVKYNRLRRSGDFKEGRQVGYTKKNYHCVSKMNDFESLISTLKSWSEKS